jgi:hypothetical protein
MFLVSAAIRQPHAATGIFRNPWPFKGRIGWMTDDQIYWSHIADALLAGWFAFAFGMCWTHFVETRAARKKALDSAATSGRIE